MSDTNVGFAYYPDITTYPIDFTVPYFSQFDCIALHPMGAYNWEPVAPVVALSTQKTAKILVLSVAGGDDLMLGRMTAIPRVRVAAKSASLSTAALLAGLSVPSIAANAYYARIGDLYYMSTGADFMPSDKVPESEVSFDYQKGNWLARAVRKVANSAGVIALDIWLPFLEKLKPNVKRSKRDIIESILEHKDELSTDSD